MQYIALLRGVNVGGNKKIEMKKLKIALESLGYENVSTYLNSGNAIFETKKKSITVCREIERVLKKEFGHEVATLIKTQKEIQKIAQAIPRNWKNDTAERTDVAYLFSKIDSSKIIKELPFNQKFIDIRYVKGAIFWNIKRKNYNKSQLNKLIGHKLYKFMTMRNINTARALSGVKN